MYNVNQQKVGQLQGVGVKRNQLYQKLGVDTVYSLLRYFPRSYLDFTQPIPVSLAPIGENCILSVTVMKKLAPRKIKNRMTLFQVDAADQTGTIRLTIFNNQYAFDSLKEGKAYLLYGKVTGNLVKKELNTPLIVPSEEKSSFRPIYPLVAGLTSTMIITNQKQALFCFDQETRDLLPQPLCEAYQLMDAKTAYHQIHFPDDYLHLEQARKRLIFEELLSWQLGLALLRQKKSCKTKVQLLRDDLSEFYQKLPFRLTNGQKNAIEDCVADCKKGHPMNRLVQGDVGCGKTMVAAALIYAMAQNGYQSAMMAPTEILATQHYHTLRNLLEPMGIQVTLLTGSLRKGESIARKAEVENGICQVAVGTHALFQKSTHFQSLGLVITDEQHRFGVAQREQLMEKGDHPHTMVMSATPIPRTLALIFYGDLDISVIQELPKGRRPVRTYAIPPQQRGRALGLVKKELQQGRQAYLVCPAIEPDDRNVANIAQYAPKLKEWFSEFSVGILHAKLKTQEKEETMEKFQKNEIQLLLGTTVVEVGVDVPNATVMMVENADLFGLSQLHQLRGRVGRGKEASHCILVSNDPAQKERLQILCETGDGFTIAEKDLALRGPGDFFGNRQHGLPDFKMADMYHDMGILEQARQAADQMLKQDPQLLQKENQGLRFFIKDLFGGDKTIL